MAQGGITLDEEVGSNSVEGISTAQCCSCDGPLPSLKSKLVCKSCYAEGSNNYLCHYCVVMHVRKSHSVTDQNGQDVEVCGEHKSVCMFMCKTCQLKWFCADCFKDHVKHEYMEISESNEDMKNILGRIHHVLSDCDFNYKRISRCLDKAKQKELLMRDTHSLNSQSDIKEGLENVCARVIESIVPNVEQVISRNQKSLSNMSVPVEEVEKALQHVGNAQVQLREMLASSLTQIARVHSNGGLDRIEKEQSQPHRVKMLGIESNDVTEYKQSLEREWKDLEDKMTALCSEFVGKFQFNKVKEQVVDLHDLRGEFKQLELPMSCERIDIAAPNGFLLLTCINNKQFTVFKYSDLKQKPEELLKMDNHVFSQIVDCKDETAVVHYLGDGPKHLSFINGKRAAVKFRPHFSVVSVPGVFHEQAVWEHINSLIHPHKLLKRPAYNDSVCALLADNVPIHQKPYSFDSYVSTCSPFSIYIFILDRFTYIHLLYKNQAHMQWKAPIEVPCGNGSKHLGRFGCCFLQRFVTFKFLLMKKFETCISNWCLDCKVLKVYKVSKEEGENKLTITCELTLEIPVLDLEKIAFLNGRCIVLTKNQQVLSCENVLANKF